MIHFIRDHGPLMPKPPAPFGPEARLAPARRQMLPSFFEAGSFRP